MLTVYVLRLEREKYYVGKTRNLQNRLDDHFVGAEFGSAWTRKYKPIDVVETIEDADDFDEDKYTLKYMSKYGIDNVRGGSFCQVVLSYRDKSVINKMITGSTDCCYTCGEPGHFAVDCIRQPLVQGEYTSEEMLDKAGKIAYALSKCCVIM